MISIILWLWQLPQHLLGLFLIKILGAKKGKYTKGNKEIFYWYYNKNSFISGVSLGKYIILKEFQDGVKTVLHEYGHSKQSLILGWLYLLIIGIYSAVFCNLWDRLFHKHWTAEQRHKWYYSRWCEAWADRLGGVKR